MTTLFQYFSKYNTLSKKAEHAIAEISSIVTIKKNKDLQPLAIRVKQYTLSKKV
jgi:hypothetical protein